MITKKLKSSERFLTYDIGLSAALATIGYELIDLEKSNIKKVQFIFMRDAGIDNAINDYWNGNLKLDARTLFDNLKRVKNQIYSI
jgi:hypothetical protein